MDQGNKRQKKGKIAQSDSDPLKATPIEYEVANYLHKNLPSIDGKLMGCRVSVFIPNDAVNILLESPWSKKQLNTRETKALHFTTEQSVVQFLDKLLTKGLFSRAIKSKKKTVAGKKSDEKKKEKNTKIVDNKSTIKKNKVQKNGTGDLDTDAKEEDKLSRVEGSRKCDLKQKKIASSDSSCFLGISLFSPNTKPLRLQYVDEQIFTNIDPESVYVWVYEPPPGFKTWLLGACLIVGIIICCLFPIWPWQLRQGAHYLTLVILSLLGCLLGLALVRLMLFVIIYLVSLSAYQFWLFPNLFEDCGFFESFRPCYFIKRNSPNLDEKKKKIKSPKSQPGLEVQITEDTDNKIAVDTDEKLAVGKQD